MFLPWEKTNKQKIKQKTINQTKPNKQLPSVLWLIGGPNTVTQADFYRTFPLIIGQATYIQDAKDVAQSECGLAEISANACPCHQDYPNTTSNHTAGTAQWELAQPGQHRVTTTVLTWLTNELCFSLGPVLGIVLWLVLGTSPRAGAARARSSCQWPCPGLAMWPGLHGRGCLDMARNELCLAAFSEPCCRRKDKNSSRTFPCCRCSAWREVLSGSAASTALMVLAETM